MRCDQCGTTNPDENNFCGICGVRLLRHPIPKASEPIQGSTTKIVSTGGALSSLGINGSVDEPSPDAPTPAADPIKPPPYLQDADIPKIPRSIAELSVIAPAEEASSETVNAEVPQEVAEPEPVPVNEETTISGPSFLGLTGGSGSDAGGYLLQDEPAPRRGGWLVFIAVAILVFVAIGWLEWNTVKTGHIKLPFGNTSNSTAAATPQPAPSNAIAAGSNTAAPNGDQDHLTTVDASSLSAAPGTAAATDNSAAPDTTATTDAKPAQANNAKDESPKPLSENHAQDAAAVEASQTRQAKEAKQRREAADTDKSSSSESAKDTPQAHAPEKKADAPQNKMLLLGEKYLYGRGVPANCTQAVVYFRAAAEQKNAPAMAHLGALYNSGQCVKQDRPQAYTWLKRAHNADPSNEWIEHDMNLLWRDMTTQERASVAR